METYHIRLEGDTLRVGFGPDHANNDIIIQQVEQRLDHLIKTEQLAGGPLLKIDGSQSVPVCYAIAHRVAHLFGAVALLDPKIGRVGVKTFVVCITHTPAYALGQLIETSEAQLYVSPVKIVLCGPPRSGKSCLREGLVTAIPSLDDAPYPYVITACPDGEGAWFSRTAQRDRQLADQLKAEYKSPFTPEFTKKAAGWVRSAHPALPLIDVGGRLSPENQQIMREATHGVILYKQRQDLEEWRAFCQDLDLKIIAEILSDYEGTLDQIQSGSILKGSIHHLDRQEEVSERQMVQALARWIVRWVQGEQESK